MGKKSLLRVYSLPTALELPFHWLFTTSAVVSILEMTKLKPGELASLVSWVETVSSVLRGQSTRLKLSGVMRVLTSLMSLRL